MKLWLALGAYAVLAGAAWLTLSDLRFRLATLVVLVGIAVKTLLDWQRARQETQGQEIEPM
jgi:membrane protein implicated in regulation of membrane protease activity